MRYLWAAALAAGFCCPAWAAGAKADDYWWLSTAPVGTFHSVDFDGYAVNAAVFGGSRGRLAGLRLAGYVDHNALECAFTFGLADCDDSRGSMGETSLLFGRMSRGRMGWAAWGISRIQLHGDRCEEKRRQSDCVTVGLPFELVAAPHLRVIGLEWRLHANINPINSMIGVEMGLRLGDLK